ncbi:MAG: choice-of-anchor L domain-containing protein [Bacteroidales bacterium]|nr:choice-of-anchor L domain-containing protein [Bacteroidales bacterium]
MMNTLLFHMSKTLRLILVLFMLHLSVVSYGQLTTTQALTSAQVAQYVQNVLIGQGVIVSNVTYTGDLQSIGIFNTGANATGLGIDSGLCLSTGSVLDLPGMASSTASTATTGVSDPQLAALITQSINDAAVLEFDFTPLSDTIEFNFVFGSEEYPEYVPSFNDVFGFFISGINPANFSSPYVSHNIALLPGTTTPVSIYNVNNGSTNSGPCVNCQYYVNNTGGTYVALDAFTTVLTAVAHVFPCTQYHIKIVIGDAGDQILDSGVFLEAGSFSSNAPTISQSTSSNVDTVAVEDCNDAIIYFVLADTTNVPITIAYQMTGTAVNGVDFVTLPNSIVIPAGQIMNSLTVSPIFDNIVEPTEYIDFTFYTTPCTTDTIRVYIKDNSELVVTLPSDTTICNGDSLDIWSSVIGGHAPYSYLWSTGDSLDSIFVIPYGDTLYSLTVTDGCGNDTTNQIDVGLSEPVFSTFGDTICGGDTAQVGVITSETYNYLWSDGQQLQYIDVIPVASTVVGVVVSDSLGCTVEDSVDIFLSPAPIVNLSPDTIICDGDNAVLRAGGNYVFLWDNGVTTANNTVYPTVLTTYSVEVTDNVGCKSNGQIEVDVLPQPVAVITVPVDTVCKGQTIILQGSGGDQYHWSTGSFMQDISISPMENADYSLTVSNVSGATICNDDTTVSLIVERCTYVYVPSAFTPNGDGLNDEFGAVGKFAALVSFEMIIYNRWGEIVFSTSSPNEMWDGTYKGVNAPNDVYTYIIIIEQMQLDPYKLSGTVQLLR